MAQVCGGSSFDFEAERRHQAAERILSQAADRWSSHGTTALSLDSVIAVLMCIYLSPNFSGLKSETRTLEQWLARDYAQEEEVLWVSQISVATRTEIQRQLKTELSFAVDQWSLGNPEQPPVHHALCAVERILFSKRLIHRPPKSNTQTLSKPG